MQIRLLLLAALCALLPTATDAQQYTIGRAAYTGELKLLPPGFHDFRPFLGFRTMPHEPVADVFCHQWEKVLAAFKFVREKEAQFIPSLPARIQAAADVNRLNGGRRECWVEEVEVYSTHVATRGYTDRIGILQPVRILYLQANDGRRFYGGYHL